MKVPLYGRASVPQVWIVDLASDVVDVLKAPGAQGYGDVRQARRGESLQIAGITVEVDEILG